MFKKFKDNLQHKVFREKFITQVYFAAVPLMCAAALALSFNYKQPGLFYLSPVFDVFAILFIVTFPKFFACNFYFGKVSDHDASVKLNDVVVMRSGVPGAGKTSSQAYEVILLAQSMWQNLQYNYIQYRGPVDEWRAEGNIKMLKRWQEASFAYKYYLKNIDTHIPCLWSNIKLELDGRISYDLTLEHLIQLKRLPGYSVLNHDDSGAQLPADLSREGGKIPPSLNRFMRYIRHFGFVLRTNDQRVTNLFIGARSVVSKNIELVQQINVCQAQLLMWLKAKLLPRFLSLPDNTPDVHKGFAKLMAKLDELIGYIGFRKYTTTTIGGTESISKLPPVQSTYYVPRGLNCTYDDRAYMLCYEAGSLEVESPVYNPVLYVDPEAYALNNSLVEQSYSNDTAEVIKPVSEVKTKQIPVIKDKPRDTRQERNQQRITEIVTAVINALGHRENTQGK